MYNQDGAFGSQAMGISPTKKAIKDFVCLFTNCSSVEVVDEFDTELARHICFGSNYIYLLGKSVIPVQTTRGMIYVEVFLCPHCRKLIINKSSMDYVESSYDCYSAL